MSSVKSDKPKRPLYVIPLWQKLKILASKVCPWLARPQRKYFMFRVPALKPKREMYYRLTLIGYQYNYWSFQSPGQVLNVRKLVGTWQYHIRIFKDRAVCGHFEPNYEFDLAGHYDKSKCRRIPESEIDFVEHILTKEV